MNISIEAGKLKAKLVYKCGGRKAYQVTHDDVIKSIGPNPGRLSGMVSDETMPMQIRMMALLCLYESVEEKDENSSAAIINRQASTR